MGSFPEAIERNPIDEKHLYTLAELIDIAQRSHPSTRIAWEQARQAALAVGIARAEYLPVLSAGVLGGFQHTQFPLPHVLSAQGYFTADTFAIIPSLGIKWLLFDFGGRSALVDAAKQLSVAANVIFAGAHQKIILDVAKAYYRLNANLGSIAVAEQALEHAHQTGAAVEGRRARGVATVVEVSLAQREIAQKSYDLVQANALKRNAEVELLEALGTTPSGTIRVEPKLSHALPGTLEADVEGYIKAALRRRPDLLAAFSKMRASEARVVHAKTTFLPRVSAVGAVSEEILGTSIAGSRYVTQTLPTASALFHLEWVLFDGGIRAAELKIAQSRNREAGHEVVRLREQIVRQVVVSYNEVTAGLKRYEAAEALARTADVAEEAAHEAFKNGVGTVTDAINAETGRAQAHLLKEQAYAEVLTAATALAFATGQLTSAGPGDSR